MFNIVSYMAFGKHPLAFPQNIDLPTISGIAQVDGVLTASPGSWTASPTVYSYQWKSDGTNVGSNQATYTVLSTDVGRVITVTVTATNSVGAGTPASSAGVSIPVTSTGTLAIASVSIGDPFKYNSGYPTKYLVGDTFYSTWADDDGNYTTICDTYRPQNIGSSNLAILSLSTIDTGTTATLVNGMSEFGTFGQKGSDSASYKVGSMISIDGVFYLWVLRAFFPVGAFGSTPGTVCKQTFLAATLIKSTNRGATWTPLPPGTAQPYASPTFSGTFTCPVFVQYGKDYADPGVHSAGAYVYAISTDAWNNGDRIIIGRVPRSAIGNLSPTDWTFFTGGDGANSANWGPIGSAASILAVTDKTSQTSIQYLPALQRYLMIQWHYVTVAADETEWNADFTKWEIYESPTPWGTWTKIGVRYTRTGLYNPVILPKSVATDDGLTTVALSSGNFNEYGNPQGNYTLTMTTLTTTPAASSTPTAYTDSTTVLDPSNKTAGITLSASGLISSTTSTQYEWVRSTNGKSSGKWFLQFYWAAGSSVGFGVTKGLPTINTFLDADTYALFRDGFTSFAGVGASGSYTFTGLVGVALDLTNSKVYFTKDGTTWHNSADPVAGTGGQSIAAGTYYGAICHKTSSGTARAFFMPEGFELTPPTGYSAWK